MSDEHRKNPHSAGNGGFEEEDLRPMAVFYFMAGLAVVTVMVYFVLTGAYSILMKYDRRHQTPVNPMAVRTNTDPRTMKLDQMQTRLENTFPKPVLERNEGEELSTNVRDQDDMLASYGWVDQKNGIVRIPIDRAMDLLAQRGLPVRPEGSTTAVPEKQSGKTKSTAKPAPAGN